MVSQSFRNAKLRGQSFNGKELRQKDFSNADLRETEFSNAILEEANFSGADLRGAKFDKAKLEKANFSSAKSGLRWYWKFIFLSSSFVLVFIVGILSAILATLVGETVGDAISKSLPSVDSNPNEDYLYLIVIFIILFIVPVLRSFLGIKVVIRSLVIAYILIIFLAFLKEFLIPPEQTNITFLVIIIPLFFAIFLVILGIEALAFNLMKVVSGTKIGNKIIYVAMFVTLAVTFIVIHNPIFPDNNQSKINPAVNAAALWFAAIYLILLICFFGWKSIEKDKEWSWAYRSAIAFAALKGTSFYKADLTDANFTKASLKNTDFREAKLTRTYWLSVQGLEQACLDTTSYLQIPQVRDLVIKNLDKIDTNFRDQDLREINLQGFKLQDFNFTDADLRQSNLENVNLYNAKLVRTKLDQTNLSNACLTGACIQDWSITKNTQREGIKCEYIYLREPTENDLDPHRMPPSNEGNFKGDDFHNYINSILDTLKLYHDQDINATVAIQVLKAMTEKYPEVKLEVVGVENGVDKKKSLRLKLINDGGINRDQFEKEYHSMYEQRLNIYDREGLMSNNNIYQESIVVDRGQVYGDISMINERSRTQNINNEGKNINNSGAGAFSLGDINQGNTVSDNSASSTYNLSQAKFGGGFAGTGGTQTGGTLNDYSSTPNLSEAAAEIQRILNHLELTNPTTTRIEQMTVVAKAVDEIDKNLGFKTQVIAALNSVGTEAFKSAINHPLAKNLVPLIEEWTSAE